MKQTESKIGIVREQVRHGDMSNARTVRPEILESWLRSKSYGIPAEGADKSILPKEAVDLRIRGRSSLCKIAIPYVDSMYQFTKGTDFMILLTDEEGVVLYLRGDPGIIKQARANGLVVGCNRNESRLGTNGIGTPLVTEEPIQVFGEEHYYPLHYDWVCSGAPIFYPNGSVAGVFCITGTVERSSTHTLGMAVTAADAVYHQLTMQQTYRELEQAKKNVETMIEAWPSGFFLLNRDWKIVQTNQRATQMLHEVSDGLVGRNLKDIFELENKDETEPEQREFENRYVLARQARKTVRFLLSVKQVGLDYAAMLESADTVHRKINRIVGATAAFSFDSIIGRSSAIQETISMARIAAQNTATVYLAGESGTGKEMFAQAIHNASPRRDGPFVAVNCGALPKSLIESELFGYEGGSFTGAQKEGRAGKFELANGGTIFLDELGDMPQDAQVALLRVLQNREVQRVGSGKAIKIDVRIITATNRNLKALVEQGIFREDLYYRINVFNISLPPLRDREGDVMELARFFLKKYQSDNPAVKLTGFAPDTQAVLEQYSWPGNVRELENVIERAVCLSQEPKIPLNCLPMEMMKKRKAHLTEQSLAEPSHATHATINEPPKEVEQTPQPASEPVTIRQAEREQIIQALQQSRGNVKEAAETLGISRRNIYRKLERYGLNAKEFRNRKSM